jgi:hypothetical protein
MPCLPPKGYRYSLDTTLHDALFVKPVGLPHRSGPITADSTIGASPLLIPTAIMWARASVNRTVVSFCGYLLAQALSFLLSLAIVESSSKDCSGCLDFTTLSLNTTTVPGYCFTWNILRVYLAKWYLYPLMAAAAVVAMLLIRTMWALSNTTTFEWSRSEHLEYLQGRGFAQSRSPVLDSPFSRGIIPNLSYFASDRSGMTTTTKASKSKSLVVATPRSTPRLAERKRPARKRQRRGNLPYGNHPDVIEKSLVVSRKHPAAVTAVAVPTEKKPP